MAEASYWVRHISAPVRFAQSIAALYSEGSRLFVEAGPKPVLAGMGQRCLPADAEQTSWLPSLRAGVDDWQVILESLGALYVRGAAVDWTGFDRDYPRTKTTAPTYPFQRQRYWFQPKPALTQATPRAGADHSTNQAGGALLGRRLPSPLRTLQFASELYVNSAAVIGEHRIFGRVVTPGVVYFEMALAAMATVGADDLQLHEVKLVQPLVLEETTSRTVQLLLTPDEGSADVPFQIFSLASGSAAGAVEADPAWKLHVEGRLRPGEAANRPALQRMVAVDEMRARCRQEMSGADFYSHLWPADFQLGKHFRRVLHLWRRDGEAIGLVQAGEVEPGAGVRSELLTLDACVQLLVAALPQSAGGPPALFVGTGQQAAHLYARTLPPQVWCQARLRGWDDSFGEGRRPLRSAAGDSFVGDLLVFDESGQVLAELAGVRFSRVAAETLRRTATADASGQQPAQHRLSPAQLASAEPERRLELARAYLLEAAAAILGMPPDKLEPEQPLVELMDSLMIVELQSCIERDLQVALPLTTLLDGAGVVHVAVRLLDELVQEASHSGGNGAGPRLTASRRRAEAADPPLLAGAMTVAEMSAEAALDEQILPAAGAADEAQPGSLFLTGATGFVGAYLCYELLQQSEADIYCLVRAADGVAGLRRVKENLAAYGLWQEAFGPRLKVVAGDLAQPRFGLSGPVFAALARQVDRIWHCGAKVKWTYPYSALKAANVLGTHEVLRLASLDRATPVHFISTVGVFSSPYDDRAAATENDALAGSKALTIGYAQSKWIAEKLVRQAGARGLPVTIYRPATAGHSESGIYNAHDHLPLLIKGCLQLGCAPELDMVVQVAPIDYVSKAMLWLAGQAGAAGQTYHLVNPHTLLWPEVVERIRMLGFRLPLIAYDEWRARLAEGVRADRDQALYAMAPFFAAGGSPLVRLPRFDCQQTLAALAPSALHCPPLEGKLLKVYIDHFVRSGFLAHESMMRN